MPKRPHETDDGDVAPDAKRPTIANPSQAINFNHADYTIGWICALPKEQTAAIAMLDQKHPDLLSPANDDNVYTLGSIGGHNIVIACLPKGRYGTNSAATIATKMIGSFPSIKFGLLVGIGGGIPSKVRLGDVVVSTPVDQYPGVVQWDFGKAEDGGEFRRTGSLNSPPNALLKVLAKLETEHEMQESKVPGFLDEMKRKWPKLYPKYFWNASLRDPQDEDKESAANVATGVAANELQTRCPDIYHGLIASGNQVIKDAAVRDRLDKDLGENLLCIEMEAAGLMNDFPCLVVRGICDYADSSKNKDWQEYAAAVAAAFAKEILSTLQVWAVERMDPVKDILSNINAELGSIRTAFDEITSRQSAQGHQAFLDWLTPIDYTLQQIDYFNKRQPGTGQWLLNSEIYQGWVDTSQQTLFCPGIPGAGKTIFTSIIVNDLFERFENDTTIGIAYVYCNFRRHDEQKLHHLLTSLIKQLAGDQSCLSQEARTTLDNYKGKTQRPSLEESKTLLQQMAASYSRVFILVDALDECQTSDGCRTNLLDVMFFLQETTKANIFATSRFIPEITQRFEACKRIEICANEDDVRRYVQGQLEGGNIEHLPSLINNKPSLKDEIVEGISNAVDGMFLLAKIYLDTLVDKVTIADVREAVAQLPKQATGSGEDQRLEILNQAYEFAWERIIGQKAGFRNIATRVLGWIICAKRPLSTKELQYALAVKVGTDELDEDAIPQVHDMVAFCAGLVTVDEESNVIRLVHYTTQEYFEKTKSNWFPDAEAMVTETCISYLSFPAFENCCVGKCCLEKEVLSQPFLEYACHYWGDHARVVGRKLDDIVMEFLMSGAKASNACTVILERFYKQPYYIEVEVLQSEKLHRNLPTSGLHLAVHFELEEAVKSLIAIGYNVNGIAGVSMTPLLVAAAGGLTNMSRMLLDSGAKVYEENLDAAMQPKVYDEKIVKALIAMGPDDKKFLSTCLEPAIQFGHEAIVELLLRKGADMNVIFFTRYGPTGYKPLHVAAKYGQGKIVKLLLDNGVDIDTQAEEPKQHYAPLHVAAKRGQMEIVKLLLDRGANVDAKFSTGKTPLHVAIKFDQEEIVELLLDKGAKVDAKLSNGNTPLHVAAKYGRESSACTKLLLSRGAIIEARNNEGRTPLFMMVYIFVMFDHFDGNAAIELLLKEGANIEAVDNMGYTPLLFAAERYMVNVSLWLMRQGANANAVTYGGQTSLHLAMHNPDPFIIDTLLENGADIEAADGEGRSPLLYAVQRYEEGFGCKEQLKNMKRLIEKGAITADDNGQTRVSHELIDRWEWGMWRYEEQRLECNHDGCSESAASYYDPD
ncbi:hypothetical protein MKX08_005650 [Trichoderma sp. CBMAI-0020]|nr:hypothetical protein MKX08_005650 [Trichoderma sp. CBMAI-0020]